MSTVITMFVAVAIAMIAAMIVVTVVSSIVISVPVAMVIAVFTMPVLIMWDIFAVVPVVLHKVDALAAGIILAAVLAPVFRVTWRYAQIDGWAVHRYPLDYHRLTVEHLWLWVTTNIELTIEAWLANAD